MQPPLERNATLIRFPFFPSSPQISQSLARARGEKEGGWKITDYTDYTTLMLGSGRLVSAMPLIAARKRTSR